MLYYLITFDDNTAVRAKSIKIHTPISFEIRTDKNELLMNYYKTIKNIVPTTSSWKTLKSKGVRQTKIS